MTRVPRVLRAELQDLALEPLSKRPLVRVLGNSWTPLPPQVLQRVDIRLSCPSTDGAAAPDGVISTSSGTIEVVASRRQQKQAQAAAAMPPPPAKLGKQPAAPPSSVPVPDWAGRPPAGFYLEVQKSGEPVQQIELNDPCTLFGRLYT